MNQDQLVKIANRQVKGLLASMPYHYRLAFLFLQASAETIDAWSRQMGALMLGAGVEGMPDPGPRFKIEKPDARALPRGYLMTLGKLAYSKALKICLNPLDAEEVLQESALSLSKPGTLKKVDIKQAYAYILTTVQRAAMRSRERFEKKKQEKYNPAEGPEQDDRDFVELQVDQTFRSNPFFMENPRAYQRLEEIFPPHTWEKEVIPALAKIHPDMPLFFQYLQDGYSEAEIINQGMLPHWDKTVQAWNLKVQDVKKVIKNLAKDM